MNKNYLLFTILATVLAVPVAYVGADIYFGFEFADSETDGLNGFSSLDDVTSVATFTNGTTPYAVVTSMEDDCVTVVQLNQPNNISAGVSKCNIAGIAQDTTLGPQISTPRDVEVWQNTNGTYAIIASQHDDAIQILDLSGVEEGHLETHWNYSSSSARSSTNDEYGQAVLAGAYDVAIFQNVSASGAMGPVAIVAAFDDNGVQAFNLRDLDDTTSLQGIVPVGNITNSDALQRQLQGNLVLQGPTGVDVFYVDDVPYAIVTSYTEDGFQVLTLRDALNQTAAYRGGGITVPHNSTGPSPYSNATDGGDQGYNLLNGVIDVATWNVTIADATTYPKSQPYAIMVSNIDDAMIIVDLQDPTFSAPNTISASQIYNSTDNNYFTALDGASSVETFYIENRPYALITANATSGSGVTLVDLYQPAAPVPVETIIDGNTDDDTGEIYDELLGANGVAHFYKAPHHYAIVASADDDGLQVIQLTGEKPNTGNALICGISRDCTAPSITTYGNNEINDGFKINGQTLENQKKYNDENETISSTVGKLVTMKARIYDGWGVESIEKVNLYFDMPKNNWDTANAAVKYLVQRDEVSFVDNNDIFEGDVSSKVVTNPYGDDSSLKMIDVTFKIMFTGAMDTSNIGVQTIDSDGNYSVIFFNDALEIVDQSGPTQTAGEDTVEGEVTQTVATVPEWVKNTAGWWSEGLISEVEFVKGVEFLIQQQIIDTDAQTTSSEGTGATVPEWVKNTAGWWADGQISENEFVSAIEHLVKTGTIIII